MNREVHVPFCAGFEGEVPSIYSPFDFSAFNTELICHELSVERRVVGVIDASFLRKSGKATEGLGKFWNSSSKKAEKGLEVSMLGVVDLIGHTAYTVDARQTVDEEGVSRVTSYEQQVKESVDNLKRLGVSHLIGDGYYYSSCVKTNEFLFLRCGRVQ